VSRYFSPDEGQTLNAQRAVGVWAVSDGVSAPVNWRLHLPQTWIKDGLRRNQASIPCEVEPETIGDC
ncbi:transposase, partial [Streptomyces sp. SID8455]|nr:transposase [Streptomyces sp. SID8455]